MNLARSAPRAGGLPWHADRSVCTAHGMSPALTAYKACNVAAVVVAVPPQDTCSSPAAGGTLKGRGAAWMGPHLPTHNACRCMSSTVAASATSARSGGGILGARARVGLQLPIHLSVSLCVVLCGGACGEIFKGGAGCWWHVLLWACA